MCWCEVFKVLSVWLADKFTVQNPMNDDTSTYLFKLYFLCTPGLESSSWRGYKQAGNTGQSPDSRSCRSAGTDSFVGALNVPLESLKVFPVLLYWALSVLKFRQHVNKNLAMQWKLRLQTANRMRKRSYSRCRNVLSELTRSHRVLCLFSKLSSSLWNRAGWSLSSSRPQRRRVLRLWENLRFDIFNSGGRPTVQVFGPALWSCWGLWDLSLDGRATFSTLSSEHHSEAEAAVSSVGRSEVSARSVSALRLPRRSNSSSPAGSWLPSRRTFHVRSARFLMDLLPEASSCL